jgi:hypothetical protein
MEFHYIFFAGDAANLLHVDKSTINRWLNSGRMKGEQRSNGWWLIPLSEINRMRREYCLPELANDKALEYLDEQYRLQRKK